MPRRSTKTLDLPLVYSTARKVGGRKPVWSRSPRLLEVCGPRRKVESGEFWHEGLPLGNA